MKLAPSRGVENSMIYAEGLSKTVKSRKKAGARNVHVKKLPNRLGAECYWNNQFDNAARIVVTWHRDEIADKRNADIPRNEKHSFLNSESLVQPKRVQKTCGSNPRRLKERIC
jgi:glutamine phosphoribosylpyrophosphate amidotransferase